MMSILEKDGFGFWFLFKVLFRPDGHATRYQNMLSILSARRVGFSTSSEPSFYGVNKYVVDVAMSHFNTMLKRVIEEADK